MMVPRRLLIPPAWLGVWVFLAMTGVTQAASLSVLSWNIQRGIGDTAANSTTQAALANVVNYLNPDVWTINELGADTPTYSPTTALNSLQSFVSTRLTIFGANPVLGSDYYVYLGTYTDGYLANAIVSRYPLLSTRSYSDAGGGYRSLRGMAFAVVDVPGTTNDVGIFTMHLKSGSLTADAARRQAEATANRTTIANWMTQNPRLGAIVTGDFNESEDPPDGDNWSGGVLGGTITLGNNTTATYQPVTTIRSAGLTDPVPVSLSGDNDTISSSSPNDRFDYVLHGGNGLTYQTGQVFDSRRYTATQLNAINAANGLTFTTGTSAAASDHLAVFGAFAVVPEPHVLCLIALAAGLLLLRARRGRRIS